MMHFSLAFLIYLFRFRSVTFSTFRSGESESDTDRVLEVDYTEAKLTNIEWKLIEFYVSCFMDVFKMFY